MLACWMPLGCDWMAKFRRHSCSRGYLLLGPLDSGITGDRHKMWGRSLENKEDCRHLPNRSHNRRVRNRVRGPGMCVVIWMGSVRQPWIGQIYLYKNV